MTVIRGLWAGLSIVVALGACAERAAPEAERDPLVRELNRRLYALEGRVSTLEREARREAAAQEGRRREREERQRLIEQNRNLLCDATQDC